MARWLVFPALGLFLWGCGAFEAADRLEREIAEGRELFLAGRPLDARARFEAALRSAPGRVEALHGFGRASAALHLYGDALPAYEEALRLSVRDGQLWEEYIAALASTAVVRRAPVMFETALEKGATALYLFPDRIGIYRSLEAAANELDARAAYLKLLGRLQKKLPDNPILAANLERLRLRIARDHELRETVEELSQIIQDRLKKIEDSENGLEELSPREIYRVFLDYRALGREGRAEALLPLLERSAEGLSLTRTYRRERLEKTIANADETSEKLRLVNQALTDYRPRWERENQNYWRLMALKFEILARQAHARQKRGEQPQEATLAELIQTGRALSTADTSNGALWHVRTCRNLVDLGVRLEDAVSFAAEGIARLERKEPGLLPPSRNQVESNTARQGLITDLQLIEAEAQMKASNWPAAEARLKTVLDNRPSAMAHALLGRSLKAQQRPKEAYPEFVAALAEGFAGAEGEWKASTRRLAEETAAELGLGARLDADIRRRSRQLKQNEEIRIVSERLDQPTPDFELTDTEGKVWSSGGLRGSVVVLNFWATWCAPCLSEFPSFAKLIKSYAKSPDVVFLAVSIDESTADIQPFLTQQGYSFTAVYDNGAAADFQVEQIPATVIIDRAGRIQYRTVGFPGEAQYMREMKLRIDALLEE